MITFKTTKKDLLKMFKHLCPGRMSRRNIKNAEECEITITDAKATFAARGAIFSIPCITKGTSKVTLSVSYFYDIIHNDPSKQFEFVIEENEMKINNLTINVATCFFEDDSILRSIKLPLNFNEVDVLQLLNDHTVEELIFNKVYGRVLKSARALDNSISAAYYLLRKYGVTRDELNNLTLPKLFKDGKIPEDAI
ncbi:MAG: hypothetical protein H0X46_07525 [Bacteroidetes bacterium]|nr:hypothetical protein [Bacteroidota bacterium]